MSELVAQTGATQPNVSNHLAVLRDAGLVAADRDGRVVRYRLASPGVGALVSALGAVAVGGGRRGALLVGAGAAFAGIVGFACRPADMP